MAEGDNRKLLCRSGMGAVEHPRFGAILRRPLSEPAIGHHVIDPSGSHGLGHHVLRFLRGVVAGHYRLGGQLQGLLDPARRAP